MVGNADDESGIGNHGEAISLDRRTLCRSVAAGGALLGGTGLAGATPGRRRSNGGPKRGFPPNGIAEYGGTVELGDGRARTFTTATPSGEPKYHGVEFDRAALLGLPSAEDLETAQNRAKADKYRPQGQAATVHYKESLQFFVPLPDAAGTPFSFVGLNWNPGGHFGGKGAWLKPHFDVHFHMLDPGSVDGIEGPTLPPYDTGNGAYTTGPGPDFDGEVTATNFDHSQLPAGYARAPAPVADQRYITDMGEHAAPADAPELPDGPGDTGDPEAFENTLIHGFTGDASGSRLSFVEPMVTREFLAGVSGTERYDIAQPEEYPHDDQHPQAYSVRDVPSRDAVAVVLEEFEQV